MKYYCQRNYPDVKLGFGRTTIASHGCFLVSLSMMVGKDPREVNRILKEAGAFQRDLIVSSKAAKALDLDLLGRSVTPPPWKPSIAEVDMSPAPGKQQHFVILMKDKIIDPWTGTERPLNTYPVVSYRLFKLKKTQMKRKVDSKLRNAIEGITGKDYKKMDTEKLQEKAGKDLEERTEKWNDLSNVYHSLVNEHRDHMKKYRYTQANMDYATDDLKKRIKELKETIATQDCNIAELTIGEALRQLYKAIIK